jgi:hypothetical protein
VVVDVPPTSVKRDHGVDMNDVTGRWIEAEGFSGSHVGENAAGSNGFMRRESDGKVGRGEDRDGRRVDHFHEMRLGVAQALTP